MNNLIELNGVSKSFAGFTLADISFSLPGGYIMGLIGPNGAGKTTTIKLMLHMLRPDSGTVTLFGEPLEFGQRAAKERIGVVMDQPFYVGEWSLLDVEKAQRPFYRQWDSKAYHKLLRDFNLDPKKKVKELSRGMSMKLMIAAALSHQADLLLLDEPTSGLDAVARNELLEILGDFLSDESRGVLFSTHITADLEKIADYITFINGGRLSYTGTKDDLLEQYCMVKGDAAALLPGQKEKILGYRGHQAGFDGLIHTEDLGGLPSSMLTEPANLDDIILRFGLEGKSNG